MNKKLITGLLIVLLSPLAGFGMHRDINAMIRENSVHAIGLNNAINDAFGVQISATMQELVAAWEQFLRANRWQDLIKNCTPIVVGCGTVYDLPNFLNRPNECFAIVDMRNITFAEPHYHPDDNFEIYFVLQGTARVVVGHVEQQVKAGDVVVIPPNKAHFTIPDENYVIACVNTPPYKPEYYIVINEANAAEVEFDHKQFNRLARRPI